MPFTGFHLIAGFLPAALAPRKFSYGAFATANVFLDLEPGWKMITESAAPLHTLHTWGWGFLAAIIAAFMWGCIAEAWGRNERAAAIAVGALIGAMSHILIDAMYHAEVARNLGVYALLPAYEAGSLVEAVLLFCGFLGAIVIVLRKITSVASRVGSD